jgi:hypothetical protein
MAQVMAVTTDAGGELPAPLNLFAAMETLNAKDGFEMTPADQHSATAHGTLGVGQFLIDAGGTIRWTFVEAPDGPDQLGRIPNAEEVLAAARAARVH